MGPLLVLVSPCLRENINVPCKIVSFFVCSLDNFILKNVVVFIFGNKFQNGAILKKGNFLPTFHIFYSPGKRHKIPSAHIPLIYIHTRTLLTILTFFAFQFCKNCEFITYGFTLVWLLVSILFRAILKQSNNNQNGEQNLGWIVYYWCLFTLMENLYSHLKTPDFKWR